MFRTRLSKGMGHAGYRLACLVDAHEVRAPSGEAVLQGTDCPSRVHSTRHRRASLLRMLNPDTNGKSRTTDVFLDVWGLSIRPLPRRRIRARRLADLTRGRLRGFHTDGRGRRRRAAAAAVRLLSSTTAALRCPWHRTASAMDLRRWALYICALRHPRVGLARAGRGLSRGAFLQQGEQAGCA